MSFFQRHRNVPLLDSTLLSRPFLSSHLLCFHLLAVVNRAAVNMGVQISLQDPAAVLLGVHPAVGLLGHMLSLFRLFLGPSILFSIAAAPFYIPTNSARGYSFSTASPVLVIVCLGF